MEQSVDLLAPGQLGPLHSGGGAGSLVSSQAGTHPLSCAGRLRRLGVKTAPSPPGKSCVCPVLLPRKKTMTLDLQEGEAGGGPLLFSGPTAPWLQQPLAFCGSSPLGVLWQPHNSPGHSC